MTFPGLELLEQSLWEGEVEFPYIPGLLGFREAPALVGALKRLRREPEVILCDGHGLAHPRGLGLACHLGLVVGIPTIGCAKTPLFGEWKQPGRARGANSPIVGREGEVIGVVLRTRAGVKPIFVSPGHLIDLSRAVEIVLACSPRYRIPAPLRAAHQAAGGSS